MMKIKKLFLILCILALCSQVFAMGITEKLKAVVAQLGGSPETLYVCQGGDASIPNSGVCGEAFDDSDVFLDADEWDSNVNTRNQKIGPGDTLVIMDDTAFATLLTVQVDGVAGHPITIKGDNDATAEFNACTTHCIDLTDREYINFEDLKITGAGDSGIRRTDSGGSWAGLAQAHINVENVNISGCTDNGVYLEGDYLSVTDSIFDDNGDASAYHHIYLIGDNMTIAGNKAINSAAGCGLRFYGSEIEVSHNWVAGNDKRPICVQLDTDGLTHQNWKILSNIIISAKDDYFIIFTNDVNSSVYSDIDLFGNVFYNTTANADGLYITDMTNFTYKNNVMTIDDYAFGFINDADATGAVVTYNMYQNVNQWYYGTSGNRTWAEWTGDGFDATGSVEDDDPEFTTAGTDFTPDPDSPLRDAGVDLGTGSDYLALDTDSNVVGDWPNPTTTNQDDDTTWEIGAYGGVSAP